MHFTFDTVLSSVVDPGQQLNQLVQNTVKAATSGLQHIFQTTKDVIKTLQAESVSRPHYLSNCPLYCHQTWYSDASLCARVHAKDWYAIFKVKVTARAHRIKI